MMGRGSHRPHTYDRAPFLRKLAALSAEIGRDLEQIQGPGGNTSLKAEGVLWVKASGTELASARERFIFTPLDLKAARALIETGEERLPPAVEDGHGRPSIEWSLHALMPQNVVLHTHDVNVIAWAVREDAGTVLAERLAGLNWVFVPYARPGLPLTGEVRRAMGSRTPDIVILGNHGLVAGGETPHAAAGQLRAVRERLELRPRPLPEPDLTRLKAISRGTRLAPAAHEQAHWTALDATALAVASGGTLYPDHAVFLGPRIGVIHAQAERQAAEARAKLVAVPGSGMLIERGLPEAAEAMAACLGMVTARFAQGARPAYLEPSDVAALTGWEAERYRQKLARQEEERDVQG